VFEKWLKVHVYCPKPGQFAAIFQDITEIKSIESKLKESEERYRKVFENSSAGIAIVNNDGKVLSINKSFCSMLGYNEKELIGIDLEEISCESNEELRNQNRHLLLKNKSMFTERQLCKKDGSKIVFEGWISIMENGTLLIIANDITERKKIADARENYKIYLEELVEEKTREIREVNQSLKEQIKRQKTTEEKLKESLLKEVEINEFRKRLITNIGHEFRTPLTTILSSMELLERYGKKWDDVKWKEHKQKVNSSVDYLANLIDSSLIIEKPDETANKITKTPFDFYSYINKAAADIITDEKQTNVTVNYNAGKILELDGDKVKIIVDNILSNAVKFNSGGEVEIEIGERNNSLSIRITDHGIGIAEEDIDQLFDPFYRGENASVLPGIGLGLAIVKKYVDMYGGIIRVDSKPGKGATFTINLPV
jgi:PAS domain S-box-containing protein